MCNYLFAYVLLPLSLLLSIEKKELEGDVYGHENKVAQSALLIIDIQTDYYSRYPIMQELFPHFESNIVSLLSYARVFAANEELIIIQIREVDDVDESLWRIWWAKMNGGHSPHLATGKDEEFCQVSNNEKLITKTSWDAFVNTELNEYLRSHKITTLYLVGIATHQCVASTAMSAFNHGYEVYMISDCCACDNIEFHHNILDILDGNVVEVIDLQTFIATFNAT
eukprot:322821_1